MTPTQFRDALSRLGLLQVEAARLLGVNERTIRKWALGERKIPETAATLLNLMVAGKIDPTDIKTSR